ncbi:MAG: CotH kinase family protein [Bacteroidales bacterium]|nr:CotH kinase family protein [Bacteroidales bacterium]
MIASNYIRLACFLLLLTTLLTGGCYKEQVIRDPEVQVPAKRVFEFDRVNAFVDLQERMLLYTLPSDTLPSFRPQVNFGEYSAISINGRELVNDEINDLGEVMVNHPYRVVAQSNTGTDTFQLFFTNLPLVHIFTEYPIRDEPKSLSWMELQFSTKDAPGSRTVGYATYAGIEIRGRTSAQLEKKSYGVELWENIYEKDRSAPILGMRYGENWILDAMYVDKLRMRNKLSFELWEKIWSRKSGSPWRTVHPGIQEKFVELFINQRYMGLFCLTEKLDESLINLSEGSSGSEGVLYKAIDWNGGATAFTTYNSAPPESFLWEGWEQVFPDDQECWGPLAELRKTVVLDEDRLFREKIDTLIDLDCMAEYYLFTNLILAHDNIIKNYYLARYPEQSRFLILPWDLEGSWGIMWHGEESSTNGLLENGLFNRLLEQEEGEFQELLESKWENYRESVFCLDSLLAPVRQYTDLLKRSGAVERENFRWAGENIDLDQELLYFMEWTALRLKYLDLVFD